MESIVGLLLRGGVLIAALLVLLGGVPYLMKYGSLFPEYRVFSGEPTDLRSVYGIVADAVQLRSRGIIQFGLLILMATPVARVAFLFFAFALRRDSTYVVITVIILSALLYSLAGGYR
jgi:uncharacterized membrane protein